MSRRKGAALAAALEQPAGQLQEPQPAELEYTTELAELAELRDHPRNYREHPDDQLEHISYSIRTYGFYRNIVIAQDGTILAGHGVARAARRMGLQRVPVRRLQLDPHSAAALKVLAGDNEIGAMAENDDRALAEILRDIGARDPAGLLGTGFSEMALANFLVVTRPAAEIRDHNEAAEWAGLPEYDPGHEPVKLIISFEGGAAEREKFMASAGLERMGANGNTWSSSWPPRPRDDLLSLKFEG